VRDRDLDTLSKDIERDIEDLNRRQNYQESVRRDIEDLNRRENYQESVRREIEDLNRRGNYQETVRDRERREDGANRDKYNRVVLPSQRWESLGGPNMEVLSQDLARLHAKARTL